MATEILRSHLEAEVKALYTTRRNTLIVAIVTILVVLSYTTWLYSMVRHFTKPENLALLVSGAVEGQIPGLKQSTSAALKAQAPALAKHLGTVIRTDVPVQMRKLVEGASTDAAGQVAKEAGKSYLTILNAVIKDAKADVAEAVTAKSDEEARAALFTALQAHIDTALKEKDASGMDNEAVFDKLERAGETLVRINHKLEVYAGTDDKKLTAKDKKTKRFIGTFWRFVQQEYPDARAEAPAEGSQKK